MGVKDKLRVMVVDDTSVSRGLIILCLQEMGITRISHEDDGRAALNAITQAPVDLVMSDYRMPEMNGLELLDAMNRFGLRHKTGFIMVTGAASLDVLKQGMAMGMNTYLRKPFSTAQMRHCIESVVGPL